MDAATLLAGALAGGADRLSPRDCWLCLAYIYSGGNTATTQLAAAISGGCDKLCTRDVVICIAYSIDNPSNPVNLIPNGSDLIPNGSVYSDQNEFVLTDMEVGSTYAITWGINDSEMTSGVQDMNTPGVGRVLTFTASDSRLFMYGSTNASVTATIHKV